MSRVNKWIDVLDRGAWTFVQTFLGTMLGSAVVLDEVNWGVTLSASVFAAAGSIVKTMAAQRVGDSGLGDAVPGATVLEKP